MAVKSKEERAKELIEKVERERGFMMPWRRMLSYRDPDYMEQYHKMAMYVFQERTSIPRKYKEIIAICIDAVTYYPTGLKAHVKNALAAGATEEEILEGLEICTLLGIHYLAGHIGVFEEGVKEFNEQKAAKK